MISSFFICNFTQTNRRPMQDVAAYRAKILQVLTEAKNANGSPRLTDCQARGLVENLSDQELEEGMLFNTPEEVAELLLESGLA